MRRLWAGLAVAGALVLGGTVGTVAAAEPFDVENAPVVDTTGTIPTAELADVADAIEELADERDVRLFVVFVDRFSGESLPERWVNDTADLSALGGDDILLAIAIDTRAYAYSTGSRIPLSLDEIDTVLDDTLRPLAREDRWAPGAAAFARGLNEALAPGPPWLIILGGGTVVVTLVLVGAPWIGRGIRANRRRREERERVAAAQESAERLLLELDDSIRTGAQEVEFAAAQFGDAAAAPYREAIDTVRASVSEAFARQRELAAIDVNDIARRDAVIKEITRLCQEGDALLDSHAEQFERLRALERDAPHLRDELIARLDGFAQALTAAREIEATLRARVGDAAIAAIDGSADQAERLAGFVSVELDRASTELGAGRTGTAAVHIRSAQQAAGQFDELIAGINQMQVDIAALEARLQVSLKEVNEDLTAAESLTLDDAGNARAAAAAVRTARAALAAAQSLAPAERLVEIERLDTELDTAIADVQQRALDLDRAIERYERTAQSAREEIRRATTYIDARRGSIGVSPRSGLDQAQRAMASAVAAHAVGDILQAFGYVQSAISLSRRAIADAQRDVNASRANSDDGSFLGGIFGGWSSGGGGGGGSRSGWSSSSRSSSSSSRSSRSSSSSRSSRSSSSSRSSRSSSSSRSSRGGRL